MINPEAYIVINTGKMIRKPVTKGRRFTVELRAEQRAVRRAIGEQLTSYSFLTREAVLKTLQFDTKHLSADHFFQLFPDT